MKKLKHVIAALIWGAITQASYGQTSGTTGYWDLRGNSATSTSVNFIGTRDSREVIFKTVNKEAFRLTTEQGLLFQSWYDPANFSNQRPPVIAGAAHEIHGTDYNGPGSDGGFLRLSAGGGTTAATKSYIDLSGDYSTVADMDRNIVFGTAGTERMRINNAGYVGIGVTDPGYALDIAGEINFDTPGYAAIRAAGDPVFQIAGTGNTSILVGHMTGPLNNPNIPIGFLGNNNVFIGDHAGYYNDGGHANTFVGSDAGKSVGGASQGNTFLGNNSGENGTTGSWNTFLGYASGRNATGSYNTFSGIGSGHSNTGNYNTFSGHNSGYSTTGSGNTFTGASAGNANTSGANNTYLGYLADGTTGTLTNATAIGYNAKVAASNSMVLGDNVNVGIGTSTPLYGLDVPAGGIRIGNTALGNNGAIRFNGTDFQGYVPGVGWTSMTGNVVTNWGLNGTHIYNLNAGNVGIGTTTPGYKMEVTGDVNVNSGVYRLNTFQALANQGFHNIFVGEDAGVATTGSSNAFVGYASGVANTTGLGNTAMGANSAERLTTGTNNTCVGLGSGSGNVGSSGLTTGASNVMLGMNAGKYCSTNATQNTYLGSGAGLQRQGDLNTYVGYGAVGATGSGTGNSSLGANSGTGTVGSTINYSTAIGYAASATTSSTVVLGGSVSGSYPTVVLGATAKGALSGSLLEVNGTAYIPGGVWTASDRNFKENISDYSQGMEVINKLHPVTFRFRDDIYFDKPDASAPAVKRNFPEGQQIGFIAQELETVLPNMVKTNEKGEKAVNYDQLFGVIVQGMQEQDEQLAALAEVNDGLKAQNDHLQHMLDELNARLAALEGEGNGSNKWADASSQGMDNAYLEQNSPNPFGENTVIRYYLPAQSGDARIVIRSDKAQEVLNFTLEHKGSGNIIVSGNSLAAGVYFCELYVAGKLVDTKKMMLVK